MSDTINITRGALRLTELFGARTKASTIGASATGILMVMNCMIDNASKNQKFLLTGKEGVETKAFGDIVREAFNSALFEALRNEQKVSVNLGSFQYSELGQIKNCLTKETLTNLSDGEAFLLATLVISNLSENRFYEEKDSGASFGFNVWTPSERRQLHLICF